ncbi:DegT/DnrJ/EryC1/StrS family aminotransferase [Halobacterium bonnevillei]|uniref:Aminotransferase class V-fold PLP-dependent enzyme n=1 Tax=Halobacterium bonnevillei TaxID=2692200 RepID=A0A6B0SJM7_9EURY|nr:DegT/DnrJ/EryC1/StrS family aminotransferase [Halobacterium bonnevillei]MXR19082.1 aminotransferase class V-fold PLP-dependent enzyme [Halobacterium bonnevillei]
MSRNQTPAIAGGDPAFPEGIGYGGQSIGEAEKEAVLDVLDRDYITRGPEVEAFEEEIADFVGADHAIAVTSGTAALHIAGLAAGLGSGDEVITTPLTFTATANAACHADAEPVFADIKPDTRNLDPEAVRERITEDTKALIPMHYAGQPCAIDELLEIADEHDLTVIWDACHALGSRYDGDRIGSESDMAMFSFHPVKNITTAEGGMVVTNDDDLAERLRSYRSFQMSSDHEGHENEPWYQATEGVGFNYNFTDIQAALGRMQLDRIEEFKERRDELVERYETKLDDIGGIEIPTVKDSVDPMWHLYAIEIDEAFPCSRGEFVRAMHAENIGVQVHYVPLHHHPHFQEVHGYSAEQFPVTNRLYDRLVSLPLHPGMSDEDHDRVVTAIHQIAAHYQ